MTPYYQDGMVTIYCGDCREILPTLGPVDVVITDPPYGINHSSAHGASWANTSIAGDADTSLRDAVLGPFSNVAAFGTWKTPPLPGTVTCLVWDKGPAFGMGDLAVPWKPSWELVYIKGSGWSGRRDEGVLRGKIVVSWESRGRLHPHEKPADILQRIITKAREGTVLDPFMGSGTTLVAAKNLGRKAIGIEIEERYCEIAAKRCSQEVLDLGAA